LRSGGILSRFPHVPRTIPSRKAKHNPDKNRLTIQFLFPKQTGGKGEAGEIILINGDVPQIVGRASKAALVENELLEDTGKK